MGYKDKLTGHGIRATILTALNELGYRQEWVDAHSFTDFDASEETINTVDVRVKVKACNASGAAGCR